MLSPLKTPKSGNLGLWVWKTGLGHTGSHKISEKIGEKLGKSGLFGADYGLSRVYVSRPSWSRLDQLLPHSQPWVGGALGTTPERAFFGLIGAFWANPPVC